MADIITPGKFPSFAFSEPSNDNGWHAGFVKLVTDSYKRTTGRSLYHDFGLMVEGDPRAIYLNLENVLLVHSFVDQPGPLHDRNPQDGCNVYIYANEAAKQAFDGRWWAKGETLSFMPSSIVGLESAQTTHETDRAERDELFSAVEENGAAVLRDGYRISMRGTVFQVKDVRVWQVYENDTPVAAAATFAAPSRLRR